MNVPPDKRGLIPKPDAGRLAELGDFIGKAFKENITGKCSLRISGVAELPGFELKNILNYDDDFFRTASGERKCEIEIVPDGAQDIGYIVLKEQIRESQRIESGTVTVYDENGSCGTFPFKTVGHKKIIPVGMKRVKSIVINIDDAREYITLKFLGIYKA